MALGTTGRRVVTTAAYLVAFHTLLAYGLPVGAFALLALALGILYYRIGAPAAVLVSASLVLVTLGYGLMLRVSGLENAIYYRPDEMLSEFRYDLGHRAYQRHAQVRMRMPYGDLQPMTSAAIGVPREVEYRIDGYGFRNDADYAGEPYVLVGDSFIAGSSNTQTDLLSAQLRTRGLAAYNLAHPGDLPDYAAYVDGFARTHRGFRVLLFVFEGNDFERARKQPVSAWALFWKRYYGLFSGTNVHRVTGSLIKRALRRAQITGAAYVTVRGLGPQRLAFLTRYIDATREPATPASAEFERALVQLKPHLAQVYFIPTNYRVYYRAIEGAQAAPLPDAKWQYLQGLCAREGLVCTNLTAPMQRAAEALLRQGELLWWPDDSHWNGRGIALTAQVVADSLQPARRRTSLPRR